MAIQTHADTGRESGAPPDGMAHVDHQLQAETAEKTGGEVSRRLSDELHARAQQASHDCMIMGLWAGMPVSHIAIFFFFGKFHLESFITISYLMKTFFE